MVVWKYKLIFGGSTDIELPVTAEVVDVHPQDNDIILWVFLDPDAERVARKFVVVGTGRFIPRYMHIGTAHIPPSVWHVFEIPILQRVIRHSQP